MMTGLETEVKTHRIRYACTNISIYVLINTRVFLKKENGVLYISVKPIDYKVTI